LEMEISMTKFFVLGSPGSGLLKVAEELYSRDDFKKTFKQDPIYKRGEFPKDIKWANLKESIDNNYQAEQDGMYELHSGWWIYKFFNKIKEAYPGSYLVVVSRHDRDSLGKIGVQSSDSSSVEQQGGEEVWGEKIKNVDEVLHSIVDQCNFKWIYVESDSETFLEDLSVIERTSEIKKPTVKIALGKI
jgi:hypothetical protein